MNFLPQHPFDNGMLKNLRDENLAPWPRPEAMIREQIAEYYGLITHMDAQIGRILNALEKVGPTRQYDCGVCSGQWIGSRQSRITGKQNVYEHSMRVPLIMTGPGIPRMYGAMPLPIY